MKNPFSTKDDVALIRKAFADKGLPPLDFELDRAIRNVMIKNGMKTALVITAVNLAMKALEKGLIVKP